MRRGSCSTWVAVALALMMCAAVAADDAGSSAPAAESKPRLVMLPAEPIPLPPIEGVATDNQLTLVEVEQLALAYHPAVREAAGQRRAAQGNWIQVGLRPNPEIGYSGEEIGNEGSAGMQGGFVSK